LKHFTIAYKDKDNNLYEICEYAERSDEAIKNAISKGADKNTIEIIDVEEIPLAYLPSNAITVKTRVVGNIQNN